MSAVKNHYHDEILARFDHDYDEPDECEGCGRLFFGMTKDVCTICAETHEQEKAYDQAH